jgi:hypothetical protein
VSTEEEKRATLDRLYAAWITAPDLTLGELIAGAMTMPGERVVGQPIALMKDDSLAFLAQNYAETHREKLR